MATEPGRVVVVTGATGRQGGAVARHLLRGRTFRVRALTRDPAKPAARALAELGAEVVAGDLDDGASLERPLAGAYGVFSVQNFWETGFQREIDQGIRLAEVAQEAGVQHFVYSSVGSAHRNTGLAHFESKWQIENHVRGSRLPWTIFRPVFFMENWENPMMADPILQGTLAFPLSPDRPLQQVTADDVGAFVALAFGDRERWLNRELDLAGDEPALRDVAAAFGRAIGHPVRYQQVPWDDFRKALGDEWYDMMRWFEDVGYNADIAEVRRIYPALTSFDAYLQRAGWARKQPGSSPAVGSAVSRG
jgi:uncharacterized protein YbjT (DUF2867 family)